MAARVVSPFQYPGSKHRVADIVWRRLGHDVPRYIEPFAGSLGVLLARPGNHDGYGEIINDADGHIVNAWRAIRHAPDEVAHWLEGPATHADLNARHQWTHTEGRSRCQAVFTDPTHYDTQGAAWFIYGLNFACHPRAFMDPGHRPGRPTKHYGQGHHADWRQPITDYLRALAQRLNRAIILAGDWSAAVTPAVLGSGGGERLITDAAVFLDPPYDPRLRTPDLYRTESAGIAYAALTWCRQWGAHPQVRICLAGYTGEHDTLANDGWDVVSWSSRGGVSRDDERLWFSPGCLPDTQQTLFGIGDAS